MSFRRCLFAVFLLVALPAGNTFAQENISGGAQVRLALARLNTLGSVLMIGAHPDDEHTDTLAYFARGRALRTGYLSLTRGEGGQNLIGPEQGELLGVIRTQELLAARRVDGAEQFFTRAIDFGFSKSPEESLEKWGRDRILSDVVWVIRSFRPDVVVLCFSGTPRDGHGHHQASSILGQEAFTAAADPKRFPEQLRWVQPWQARRLVWNIYGGSDRPGQVKVDTGEFNPDLGYSYAEIAALSRSMHRSQGMGMERRRGSIASAFAPMAGTPAKKDLFEDIDTSWNRVPGGGAIGARLAELLRTYDASNPAATVPALLEVRDSIAGLHDPWAVRKLAELDETVALAAGLWLDASAESWQAVPGGSFAIHATALRRSELPVRLVSVAIEGAQGSTATEADLPYNQAVTRDFRLPVAAGAPFSQPFWLARPRQGDTYSIDEQTEIGLAENPPLASAHFRIALGNHICEVSRPVRHHYVEGARGGLDRPLAVVPPVAVAFTEPVYMLPSEEARKLELVVTASVDKASGQIQVTAPAGWRAAPDAQPFEAPEAGQQLSASVNLVPPAKAAHGAVRASASVGGKTVASGMRVISYPHFPPQVVFPAPVSELVHAPVKILARRVGYVMGAGDQVPDALRQLGCEVALLSSADLATGNLDRFDAIVTGVRAYNTRPDLRASRQRLLDYVSRGGTLVVQYNVVDRSTSPEELARMAPYPVRIGHERVSVEEAPVAFTDRASPLVSAPNAITAADFDGWVQERGLYFAGEWDPRYKTLFESHDPGEAPHAGGTLYTRYGKGAYVFTAYSWFRELPAGVPGAYRIFANLLSAARTLEGTPSHEDSGR
ncbi:MAG TPA: PIG-L family deacetylase [Bryobacteraceae bacterium]|nr:PIG-L family deacetylase [Bryobacteraceae bacterium]